MNSDDVVTDRIAIIATPLRLEPEEEERIKGQFDIANAETKQFREDIKNAGYVRFEDYDIRRLQLRGVLPKGMDYEEANHILNTATHAFSLGIKASELESAVGKSDLLPEQKEFLTNTADVISHFEEKMPNVSKNLDIINRTPTISIAKAPLKQKGPGEGQMLLSIVENKAGDKIKSKIVFTAGKGIAEGKAKDLAKIGVKKFLKQSLKKRAFKEVVSDLLAVAAIETGPGALLAKVISKIAVEIIDKVIGAVTRFLRDNKEGVIAASLIGGGVLLANPFIMWSGVGLFTVYVSTQLLLALAIPFVAAFIFLVGAILTIIFIFQIIFRGGFVVPYFDSFNPYESAGVVLQNPDIGVGKVASPTEAANPRSITYTITVFARVENLSNIHVSGYTCKAIKEGGVSLDCPEANITIDSSATATSGSTYTFDYTVNYGSQYQDSLVVDTITVTADTPTKTGVSASGTASVCFGDCPSDCIQVSDKADNWPPGPRSSMQNAVSTLVSSHPAFTQKVCASTSFTEVNLCYAPSQVDPWGWHIHNNSNIRADCDILFDNDLNWGISGDMLYILTHELTHHIQNINGSYLSQYKSMGAWAEAAPGFCSYTGTHSDTESMAEATGAYLSIPSYSSCIGNYQSKYPKNYEFARDVMFK